jgi:hypothetical protein
MHSLQREAFLTSRAMDFATDKGLTTQTGHPKEDWPLVVLKELIDNGLDACEEARVSPRITVTIEDDFILVEDNGRGLPPKIVEGLLDFDYRVSTKAHYVTPTRGAQGNALKTVLAIPFVLSGNASVVEIAAAGHRHHIRFSVDPLRQELDGAHDSESDETVKNGTSVKILWPPEAIASNYLRTLTFYHCSARTLSLTLTRDFSCSFAARKEFSIRPPLSGQNGSRPTPLRRTGTLKTLSTRSSQRAAGQI